MADEVTGPSPRGGPEDLKPSEKSKYWQEENEQRPHPYIYQTKY